MNTKIGPAMVVGRGLGWCNHYPRFNFTVDTYFKSTVSATLLPDYGNAILLKDTPLKTGDATYEIRE